MADRSVVTRFEAKVDGYLRGVTAMSGATEKFAKNAVDSATKHKASWDKVGNGMLVTGAVIAAGVGLAVKSFAEFDKEMSNVRAVSGASAKEMTNLKAAAIQAGQATKFSASEAAAAEAELAKAGVSVADIMGGALTGSLNLAAAGNIDLAQAATLSAQAMNIFNLQGRDVAHIADVLTAGANKSAAGVDDLGLALQQGGLVAKQTGLSLEDTVGTLSAFADNALKSSDAGTSLKTMLQRLNPQSKEASELMDALGLRAYDAQGQFVGVTAYAGKLQTALKGMSAEQRNAALQTLFGSDAVRGANILYEQGAAGMAKYIAQVNDQGAASRMAAIQMDNLRGDLEQLKGSLETALIQSGSGANTVLRDMVQLVTGAVNAFGQLPQSLQSGALGFAAVSAAALITAGGVIKTVTALASAKKAIEEIGIASKLASAAGPVGLALGVLTVAVGLFAKSQLDAKAKADDLRASLDQQTGAITDNTRALVAKTLQESGSLDSARALGVSLKDVTDAALGNADATKRLRDAQAALQTTVTGLEAKHGDLTQAEYDQLVAGGDQLSMFKALLTTIGATSDVLNPQITAQKQVGEAMGTTTVKATGLVQTETQLKDAAKAAAQAHDTLLKAVQNFGQSTLDARGAARDYQAALDDATKAVKENGRTLSVNTEKGRANQVALEAIRTTALKSITANMEHGASLAALNRQVDGARAQFVTFAAKMGFSKSEANKLANQLGLTRGNVATLNAEIAKTPTAKNTQISISVSGLSALQAAGAYLRDLRDKHITLTVGTVKVGNTKINAGQLAGGGPAIGPGTGTSDSIPSLLSNGEHVLTAAEVQKAGGQDAIFRMRAGIRSGALRFRDGGAVGPAKFADGGAVDFSSIMSLLGNVTDWSNVTQSRSKRSSTANSLASARNALASLINQQHKASRDLASARKAGDHNRINDILDKQRLLLGKVAAAEGKVAAARVASANAAKATAATERAYRADRAPTIDRAISAAAKVNSSTKAFLDNIDKLSKMGFRTLALDLLNMGGPDAARIAAQAVRSAAKAKSIQSQFASSAALSAREATLKDALSLPSGSTMVAAPSNRHVVVSPTLEAALAAMTKPVRDVWGGAIYMDGQKVGQVVSKANARNGAGGYTQDLT